MTDATEPAPPSLRDVVSVLDAQWDPAWADDWDAVGTSVGDLDAPVRKVLLAVDPTLAVVDEAIAWGADLLLTHHPLLLKGVHGVATDTPKGRIVHRLVAGGVALHTCHTNADSPPGGVSASMADALGLVDVRPLDPDPDEPLDKWVLLVPSDDADRVADAMLDAGAGHIGDYDRCTFVTAGIGSFRPLEGADPTIGTVGEQEHVAEDRVEMVARPGLRAELLRVLREVHPYEEPAFDVLEMAPRPGARGSGRIGTLLEPTTLAAFAADVVAGLPATSSVARVAGDPDREVRTVALCGGSGDFLLDHARRAGADVYVTSDMRHHPVSEARELDDAPAIVDVPHWAAEWTWLPSAERLLSEALAAAGSRVETRVSRIVTDPWTAHVAWPSGATTPRRHAP
ncbi:MAG: Nif3-like dinuclear metal center hexameric protein [Nocardioidaceae bacterium]|nr:Nif3-like dinuclear metal center hexameric protein [Nocardioidaceae bacterium]